MPSTSHCPISKHVYGATKKPYDLARVYHYVGYTDKCDFIFNTYNVAMYKIESVFGVDDLVWVSRYNRSGVRQYTIYQ